MHIKTNRNTVCKRKYIKKNLTKIVWLTFGKFQYVMWLFYHEKKVICLNFSISELLKRLVLYFLSLCSFALNSSPLYDDTQLAEI
jgi:hypothetical protein